MKPLTVYDKVMDIINLINAKMKRILFTTPSHSQKPMFTKWLGEFYKRDFSEIEGFDNLHFPNGAILNSQNWAAEIYNTAKTFYLTNGSTSGIIAIMKAILNFGDRVLVARNCHKSVFSGAVLSGSTIDWIMPEINEEWGIYGGINLKTLEDNLKLNDYKAFILTSPTYEGINSDIEKISEICHKHNTYLIVDEAHGALYNFSSELPKTAIERGADFSVNSLHKTAGALNPAALLHVSKNCLIDYNKIQNALNLITTTSPSYPLLANIEGTIEFLSKNGEVEIKKLIDNIKKFEEALSKKGYEFLNEDITKILIKKEGINPKVLSEILFDGFNIEDEMVNSKSILFLTGIGTDKKKLKKLQEALDFIKIPKQEIEENNFQPYPLVKVPPSEIFSYGTTIIKKEEALLKISAEAVVPYPPCCAILYPGEAIQEWHLNYLDDEIKVLAK